MPRGNSTGHQIITLLTNHATKTNQHPQRRAELLNAAQYLVPVLNSPQRCRIQTAHQAIQQPTHQLRTAIQRNNRNALRHALEGGGHIKPAYLFEALELRRFTLFTDLLAAYHGSMTIRDTNGYTLLHQAVRYGDIDAVRVLISKSIGLNVRGTYDDVTPLHLAVEHNRYDIAKLLVESGAQLTRRESINGFTPLHDAAYDNRIAIAKDLLLPHLTVSDINAADTESGKTPLHVAVSRKHYEMVSLLLRHGANPYITTKQRYSVALHRMFPGQDAFDMAKKDVRMRRLLSGRKA